MADFTQAIEFRGIDNVSKTVGAIGNKINMLGVTSKSLSTQFSNVSRTGAVLANRVKYIGVTVAAAAASVFWLSYRTSNAAEDMLNLSQKTGVGVDALQQLGYVADQANIGADNLSMSFKFLNRSISDAAADGTSIAAQAFQGLGIQLTDANGTIKTTEQVFYDLSDAFAAGADGPNKVNAAMKLLGRSGESLIPILNRGADALKREGAQFGKYGNQIDQSGLQAISDFNKQVNNAMLAVKSLGSILAQALIPYLQPLVTGFADWVASNKDLIRTKLDEWIRNGVEAFKELWPQIKEGAAKFVEFMDSIGGWKTALVGIAAFMASDLIGAFSNFTLAVGALGLAFTTTPIGVFLAMMGSLYLAVKALDEAFPNLGKTVAGTIDIMINKFKDLFHLGDKAAQVPLTMETRVDPATGKATTVTKPAGTIQPQDFSNPQLADTGTSGKTGFFEDLYNKLRSPAQKPLDVHIKLDTDNKVSYAAIDSPLNTDVSINSGPIINY